MERRQIGLAASLMAVALLATACQTKTPGTNAGSGSISTSNSGALSGRYPVGSAVDLIGGFISTQPASGQNRSFTSTVQFEGQWNITCPVGITQSNQHLQWPANARIRLVGTVQSHNAKGFDLASGCQLILADNQVPKS